MPIFICEGCNETLKRNKVSQHQWSCKRSWVLSCMDCNKRFEGEDYLQHTTCMSRRTWLTKNSQSASFESM